jgi:uncharacterized protein
MAHDPALVVPVAELCRHPASRRRVTTDTAVAEAARVGDARLEAGSPVSVDVELESLSDGIVVTGVLRSEWHGECRRCLGPASGPLVVDVRELYRRTPAADDDAYAFDGEVLDLRPLVQEALALDLPLAPLCRPDCAGLCPMCGANRNEADCGHRPDTRDPRWAALDALRAELDLGDS